MNGEQQGAIYRWRQDKRLDLAAMLALFRQHALLPEEASWWFGWNEVAIALPRLLRDIRQPDERWDVLHVFSPRVELRYICQGRSRRGLLLMEEPVPPGLEGWDEPEAYRALPALRLLSGTRLQLPEGNRRGVVAFPRPLDYDIGENDRSYQDALVADVRLYHDTEARLHTVRYLRLRHMPPGDNAGRIEPYNTRPR